MKHSAQSANKNTSKSTSLLSVTLRPYHRPFATTVVRRIAFSLFLLAAGVCMADSIQWELCGSFSTARTRHTATLLNNAMVLVAGSYDVDDIASAELDT